MMNKLIQKMINTVIANLANTSEIGLFNGKMGITLFMYEYAKTISDNTEYEEIADLLIDDIYSQIKPDMPLSLVDGYAGVGFGLSYLLKEGLIDGDPDDVLQDIDKRLLENPKDVLSKEMMSQTSVFSSGLYFLSRVSFCNDEQKKNGLIFYVMQ